MSEAKIKCIYCKGFNVAVARDMLSTRHCGSCNHKWLPEMEQDLEYHPWNDNPSDTTTWTDGDKAKRYIKQLQTKLAQLKYLEHLVTHTNKQVLPGEIDSVDALVNHIKKLEEKCADYEKVLEHPDFEGLHCECGYYGDDDEDSGMSVCLLCEKKTVLEKYKK